MIAAPLQALMLGSFGFALLFWVTVYWECVQDYLVVHWIGDDETEAPTPWRVLMPWRQSPMRFELRRGHK